MKPKTNTKKFLLKPLLIGGLVGLGVGVFSIIIYPIPGPISLFSVLILPFYAPLSYISGWPIDFFSNLSSDQFLNIAINNFLIRIPYLIAWLVFGIMWVLIWWKIKEVQKKWKRFLLLVFLIVLWIIIACGGMNLLLFLNSS